MKELSIEQKARAYDKAREKIAVRFGTNVAEEIFSEFEESEDEKIRKEFCKDIWTFIPNEKAHKYISWLAKQGETFTKKDVDDAYLKGISDTKNEFEKQGGQKPAKWSLEDERVIAIINNALTESNTPPDDYDKVYDWLESIKQRIGWKPSNEQIEALEHFVRSIGESGYASPYDNNTKLLYSLLEQLKKLKA